MPRNALAPMNYMREVAAVNNRQRSEMQAADAARKQEESRRRAKQAKIRKMMAPKPRPPGPRYENPFPRTEQSMEAERQADELIRIRNARRNALAGL